ncbi:hypothetical protein TEK04_10375 [Klenkia sp. LSe6-5]|uniref:Uncharacterized protein n=1 Tax=Klenkia sesuvii TaxID=3103137 RepID=A0ABU8DU09_9ACTN|nr:hypothetical protein [Klenkia sp. PcliD-1-E]MCO7220070.1 hypothetical protein [Klenkia sp. PcliD-1-E]
MDAETEDLSRRLSLRFPDIAIQHIEAIVDAEGQRLAERPIQDFVPVLLERAAVERLRRGSTAPSDH